MGKMKAFAIDFIDAQIACAFGIWFFASKPNASVYHREDEDMTIFFWR